MFQYLLWKQCDPISSPFPFQASLQHLGELVTLGAVTVSVSTSKHSKGLVWLRESKNLTINHWVSLGMDMNREQVLNSVSF